jgi:hypothetical protein
MADQFTTVKTKSWGSRLMNSVMGVGIGILLFLGSFYLLFWNEGRVDMSKVAETAVAVSATADDPSAEGKLVSVSGTVVTDEKLGDNKFLKPGDWLALERTVEMYAWKEDSETKSQKNLGGSETETTTYTYTKEWSENPEDSADFENPANHENPDMAEEGGSLTVTKAKLGIYDVDPASLSLPGYKKLTLEAANLTLPAGYTLVNGTIFKGTGTLDNPQVGDLRISFSVLPNNAKGTVFAKKEGNSLITFRGPKNSTLYRLFSEDREAAIATLASEHKMITWILRAVGFLMMWIGLSMVFGPLSVFLDVIPALGSFTGAATGGIAFIVSLILSIATILVSMLLHSLIAVIIVAVVIAGGVVLYMKRK